MSYGATLSAAGALTALYRQDVLANNLANVSTPGFKPDVAMTRLRDPVRIEDGLGDIPSNRMLERLGGGLLLAPTSISFAPGPIQETGNPLDVAIEGEGFLSIAGDGGEVHLTRDGRMTRSAEGTLVHSASGRAVLDEGGRPIAIREEGTIQIDRDGTIHAGGERVARLDLTQPDDVRSLRKRGDGLFAMGDGRRAGAAGFIRQGAVEGSGVDPVKTMIDIGSATREVSANFSMIQQHDRLMDQAINRLGRVV